MTAPWIRHNLPPWLRRSDYRAEYGMRIGDGWVVVSKRRIVADDTRLKPKFVIRWVALWAPAGFDSLHPSIVVPLFACHRLKAALALAEAWAATSKSGEA